MYRTGGLVTLLIGSALTYSLVFTGFDRAIDSWRLTPDGGVEQVRIECPAPWGSLFGDALAQIEPAWHAARCTPSARTLLIEGVVVSGVSLSLGLWAIRRGARPPVKPMETLPSHR